MLCTGCYACVRCLLSAVGKAKGHVVSACRQAIKENDTASLVKIIKYGQVASS